MRNQLFDIARDPSCILAVTPHFGGSWGSPLRPGEGNPWPSPTPRNFAAEPYWWRDWTRVYREVVGSQVDFELLWDFEVLEVPTSEKSIFYASGLNCGVSVNSKRFIIIFRCIDASDESIYGIPWEIPYSNPVGTHQATIKRVGSRISFTFDGEEKLFSKQVPSTLLLEKNILYSNFGLIHTVTIKKNGKTVWSYPSEAERVRLLTYDNVRTNRGVFEQADTTNTCKIRTPFRTGGLTTSLSMLTRISVREQGLGYLFFQNSGNGLNILIASNRLSWEVRFADTQRTITVSRTVASSFWNGDHVVGMVLDRSKMTFSTIIDDTIESSVIMPEVASSQSPLLGLDYSGDIYTSGFADTKIAIKWHMVFDRALKPAEIIAISQC